MVRTRATIPIFLGLSFLVGLLAFSLSSVARAGEGKPRRQDQLGVIPVEVLTTPDYAVAPGGVVGVYVRAAEPPHENRDRTFEVVTDIASHRVDGEVPPPPSSFKAALQKKKGVIKKKEKWSDKVSVETRPYRENSFLVIYVIGYDDINQTPRCMAKSLPFK